MRFNMDFSAVENGLLLAAVEHLNDFHTFNVKAEAFRSYYQNGVDVGQVLDILKNKAEFMVSLQNGDTLEQALQKQNGAKLLPRDIC